MASQFASAQSATDGYVDAAATRAFPVAAHLVAGGSVALDWSVRPTFQIYRDSIRVRPIDAGVSIGPLALPAGIREDDPYFGHVSVLTGLAHASFRYRVPPHASPMSLHFAVTFRGCHTAAPQFCFPPITTIVTLPLVRAGRGMPP